MTVQDKPGFFDNYTRIAPAVPQGVWWVARAGVLAGTLGLATVLVVSPTTGLRLFWGLAIPLVPLLLVVAPGLWRQVCPMAFLNQLPRSLGFTRGRDLPEPLRNAAFGIAMAALVGCVAVRPAVLNQSATVVAAGILLVLALAFVGGLVFKGRSGWCGTFCPLGPIQRTYGQAPLVLVRNGYCTPCLGCQKNCYDFNPRAAVFSDVYDDDPRYAGQRRLFMGLLPGLVLGYFMQGAGSASGPLLQVAIILGACALSAGLYSLAVAFLPVSPYRVSVAFGAIALSAFYTYAGPIIVGTLSWLAGTSSPAWLEILSQAVGVLAAAALVTSGLHSERRYAEAQRPAAPAAAPLGAPPSLAKAAGTGPQATDRGSGATFDVAEGASLLDAIQAAGLKINYGCRAGVCGADAVAVLDGADNLSPPGPDELATLRRLGLEGKARLACVCQVKGPVLIDRDPKSTPGPALAKPVTIIDRARLAGIGRVVIIGNGIAGTSTAEALRRDSPSLAITLVTNEPNHFYNRMAIGRLVYDGSGMDGLQLIPDGWFAENDVTVLRNTVAVRIDRAARTVSLATGDSLSYDKLVIATGARSSTPTPDFLTRRNAFVLRSVEDAQAIRTHVQQTGARRAVVIGGGVLGVEAADALHHLGLQVILLQRGDRLMNAQLAPEGAARLARYLDGIGIQVVVNAAVTQFDGEDLIRAARLAHGPRIRGDLFVACLGITANAFLAQEAGLPVGRGIKVNRLMQTPDPDIFAVGDVAEIEGQSFGLWPVGAAQAHAAAQAIYGTPQPFSPAPGAVRLKCDGIDVVSQGDLSPGPGVTILTAPADAETWWTLAVKDGRVIAGQFVGPPGSSRAFSALLQSPADPGLLAAFLARHGAPTTRADAPARTEPVITRS